MSAIENLLAELYSEKVFKMIKSKEHALTAYNFLIELENEYGKMFSLEVTKRLCKIIQNGGTIQYETKIKD